MKLTPSRASNAELLSANLKLVSSHLDLVSLVTLNLKRVTYPLESAPQTNRIDYPMLRQFEQALLPPPPLRPQVLPWISSGQQELKEVRYRAVQNSANDQDLGLFYQNDRGLLSERLENLSMRFIRRVETIDTASSTESRNSGFPDVGSLLERLRDIRSQIGDAVGIGAAIENDLPLVETTAMTSEPQNALREELVAWNQLESRIQYEILHPGLLSAQASANPLPPSSALISIPSSQPLRSSISVSPLSGSPSQISSSEGSFGSIHGSPELNDYSWQLPQVTGRRASTNRAVSLSSASSSSPLVRALPCSLYVWKF